MQIEGLSSEQLRFYALHQLSPGDPDLYVVRVLRVRGALDEERLRRALACLIQRHDALRATVPLVDGEPRLALRAELPPPLYAGELERLERELRAEPAFDVARGPLFTVTVISLDGDHRILVLRFHHLICDGASARRFVEELWAHYGGAELPRAPSFRDFARWEAARASDSRTFWSARLAGAPTVDVAAALCPHRGRPPVHTREAATLHLPLSPSLFAALRAFCRAERVTPYVALVAVLARQLAQVSGARDFLVATPLAARARRDFQSMLGALIHWIALRPRLLPGQSFSSLVAQLRGELAAAYDHATSYEALISAAGVSASAGGAAPRDPSRNPRFQITLNYTAERAITAPPGLEVSWDPVTTVRSPYDLALRFEEQGEACSLGLTYYAAAIDAPAAARFAEDFLALAAHLLAHPDEAFRDPRGAPSLVVAATFTAEPLAPVVDFWLAKLGLPFQPVFAPAGQLLQQLVDPHGLLAHNALGANALLVRYDDWKDPAAAVAELRRLLVAHAERSAAPTIVVVCPPRPEHRSGERAADFAQFTAELTALADDEGRGPGGGASALSASRLHVLRWEDVVARYPVDELDDRDGDAYAQAPYSADFTIALGTALCRQLCAIATPPPKVLALDCDGTLWRGVVGEDGPAGLVVGEGHAALQAIAVERQRAGTLLCLASKNEAADVWAAFAQTPGMLLRREHVSAHRVDWQPKSQNLLALAAELGLGVDSFLFLDDSPAECAEVRARCPAALSLELPAEDAARHFLEHVWPLDARKRTTADRARAAMLRADAERQELRAALPDLAQFLASLEVELRFAALSPETAARAAQLTQRTNQFNTTTVRRSEAELLALPADKLVVDVRDRFGDYGTVGLVVYRVEPDVDAATLVVDSWLLSCRALGRGVEAQILVELARRAAAAGCASLYIAFVASAKNRPAAQLLDSLAPYDGRGGHLIPVDVALRAAELSTTSSSNDPSSNDPSDPGAPSTSSPTLPAIAHDLWRQIATQLDTVAKIRAALVRPRAQPTAFLQPRDEDERMIAAAWCAALHLRELGADDDYFAIGGDSIRSLAVVAELRRAGRQVSSLELHEHPTVARLAAYLRERGERGERGARPAAAPIIPSGADAFPLSFAQRYVVEAYARENLAPERAPSGVFHVRDRFTLELHDVTSQRAVLALRRSFADLIACTAPLRSHVFAGDDGQLWQETRPYCFDERDFFAVVAPGALDALVPFDPRRGDTPLLRGSVAVTSPNTLELVVAAHHGFCDGWSLHQAYSRLFCLADAYLSGDEDLADRLRHGLTDSGDGFRQLIALEQPRPSPSLPSAPLSGPPDSLSLHLDAPAFARVRARARTAAVSVKAVVLAAFAEALGQPPVIAVVTNGRPAELPRPLDVFGLCWSFAPIAAAPSLAELHQQLLDAEAEPPAPAEVRFGGAPEHVAPAAFNFVHFHHARWRQGTPHLRIAQRTPTHRFPFPLDLTARLEDRDGPLTLELTWNATAQLHRNAAAALLAAIASTLDGAG